MREIIFIVFVKPMKNIQQCLSVYSLHKSNDGAVKATKEFILAYPEGYWEVKTFTLKK